MERVRRFVASSALFGGGRAGVSAADDVQDRAVAAMVRAFGRRGGGGRARPAVVSALLRHSARRGDAGPFLDLAVSAADRKLGLSERLLAEVNRQLDARGLIVKRGTLVDATIIAAAVKPPKVEEGQVNERDPDASFTVKNDETYFGYKAHLAVDEESGVVRQAEMTSADLHDSQRGEAMIQGDEKAYYADKAYDAQALRDKLNDLGIEDKIAYKAKRNKPLVNWQVWFNKTASSIRVGVERANATMKNWYGMEKVRYLGLDRNNCHLQFVAMAMNMKRAMVLIAAT